MVLLFYADDCITFIPYKYKIDEVYPYLQKYLKIEDDGDLNKHIGIELDRFPYGSINLMQPYPPKGSSI